MTAFRARVGRFLKGSSADERGEVAVIEVLLWLPVVVVLLGTMGVALRQNATAATAQDAAEAAARAARMAVTAGEGAVLAEASLARSFTGRPERCTGRVDTSGWDAGTVEVTVTCDTDFGGLAYVTPGGHQVTRSWVETVDAARIARTGP